MITDKHSIGYHVDLAGSKYRSQINLRLRLIARAESGILHLREQGSMFHRLLVLALPKNHHCRHLLLEGLRSALLEFYSNEAQNGEVDFIQILLNFAQNQTFIQILKRLQNFL